MELYDSEEQQVEAIKDWWKENGKAVIFGAVIGLGGLFGWRYYQDSVVEAREAASESYTSVISTLILKALMLNLIFKLSSTQTKTLSTQYLLLCN